MSTKQNGTRLYSFVRGVFTTNLLSASANLKYASSHCTYTIPAASALTVLYYPFFTAQDRCKICILITISIIATIPWDSYLIRCAIWTYPPDAVVGSKILDIPVEEVFFFVIQTYITSVAYCIFTKPLVRPMYLRPHLGRCRTRNMVAFVILTLMGGGIACLLLGQHMTYLGLILVWVCPILLFQWMLSHPFLIGLPGKPTIAAICLPTLYLWVADSCAMESGTWRIESGTKLDYQIGGLEVESSNSNREALFFLVTNMMIVLGLIGIDYAYALQEYKSLTRPAADKGTTLRTALSLLCSPPSIDESLISALSQAVYRLQEKSQSMFLGSALFQGHLRIDLIFLYSFCRVMDDLIDEAEDEREAGLWVTECKHLLDLSYRGQLHHDTCHAFNKGEKYERLYQSMSHLSLSRLTESSIYDLLEGFETDLAFDPKKGASPIRSDSCLDRYAGFVAGAVGTLVLDLVLFHHGHDYTENVPRLGRAAKEMGKAMQCVNIARDIHRDAAIGRVYIPTTWLDEVGLTPGDVLEHPNIPIMYGLQERMLQKADGYYQVSREAIEELPRGVRGPLRATVESYMDIGRLLREQKGTSLARASKMRVPLMRRLKVGWLAML
ncbi:terpenoid synthase [Aspergillus vadensis CBS 113365]|uniref:Bifunctional lycopene cyclase/phytoene synthase n=1 Tax=Aspergillus vadensis (strain CBS 113365 / IMI 142717 / IBT 24658) TaxID=1448311 RepID=A0A319B4V3_ASPVC|nr:terpenoid synthase [Aspergillus vadensis CBS 113365]PYH67439.1 terpenoid synthase [Aspergillus vadensis CBS 113365]